jgi:hypothetical protein
VRALLLAVVVLAEVAGDPSEFGGVLAGGSGVDGNAAKLLIDDYSG